MDHEHIVVDEGESLPRGDGHFAPRRRIAPT
jgi:hypothetical protein